MGRPLKRKYFGVSNVNDGQSYSGTGGESVVSFTITNVGSNYSQGVTLSVAPSPIGGTTALDSYTEAANGSIMTVTVSNGGTGYDTAPAVTINKPGNVATTATSYYPASNVLTVGTTTGLYIGMAANVGFSSTARITTIYTANSNVVLSGSNTAALSGTPISFGDIGSGAAITAVLASPNTTANTIQANAWITGGTIGKIADIVKQEGARRYKVVNADGTALVNLYGNAAIVAAGGPIGPGQMTITATDSAGGTYFVEKLYDRTATLNPITGTQFTHYQKVKWVFNGPAVLNTSVTLAQNN